MTTAAPKADTPKIFRITLEVSNLEEASAFYAKLLGVEGKRHPGARHYFDCGGVILALLDPTAGGLTPTPAPKSLYFAVHDVDAVHARARALKALAPYEVHGEPRGRRNEAPLGRALLLRGRPLGE
jgi:catechol 2,3-dioxygenase-like lactoylglutathione lyase family enzyme